MGQMRKYQPLWEKLKAKGKASIAADPRHHATIRKAVIKEKYNDINYKFDCSQASKKARLGVSISGNRMNFTLQTTIGMDDL